MCYTYSNTAIRTIHNTTIVTIMLTAKFLSNYVVILSLVHIAPLVLAYMYITSFVTLLP